MTKFIQYSRYIIIAWVTISSILYCSSIYIDPNSGDLARMGGYPENWFGWTIPQQRFTEKLYAIELYDRYYDILIFGDSFSAKKRGEQTDLGSYWQNFLAKETGLSIVVIDSRKSSIQQILSNPIYQNHPPRMFILENIERDIRYMPEDNGFGSNLEECRPIAALPTPILPPLTINPLKIKPISFNRNFVFKNKNGDFPLLDLNQASNILKKRMLHYFFGINNTQVAKHTLTRNDLFSNIDSDELLIFKNEYEKKTWDPKIFLNIHCKLIALQNKIQKNGITFFGLMIATDRLTAYSDFLENKNYADLSQINKLDHAGLHLIRTDQALIHSITKGVKDIYFPNDTHWGVEGHKIAAAQVLKALVKYNILINKQSNQNIQTNP